MVEMGDGGMALAKTESDETFSDRREVVTVYFVDRWDRLCRGRNGESGRGVEDGGVIIDQTDK